MTRRLLCSLAIALTLPCALQSQTDNTAAISGYAKSAFNGGPLASVMISVAGTTKFAVTDSTGAFRLSGLPAGTQLVRISYLGRDTEEYEFELRRGKTKRLAIILDVEAVNLDPVVVTVRHRDGWRDLAGFYERRKFYGGFGNFYTREDIVRLRARSVGDILRRMGIHTRCLDNVGCVPSRWVRGNLCAVSVAVDGMAFFPNEYETVLIDDVQGIEAYRGDNLVPPGWRPMTMTFDRDHRTQFCGSVAIWTR